MTIRFSPKDIQGYVLRGDSLYQCTGEPQIPMLHVQTGAVDNWTLKEFGEAIRLVRQKPRVAKPSVVQEKKARKKRADAGQSRKGKAVVGTADLTENLLISHAEGEPTKISYMGTTGEGATEREALDHLIRAIGLEPDKWTLTEYERQLIANIRQPEPDRPES